LATLDGTIFDSTFLQYAYFDETGDCNNNWQFTTSCDGYDDASFDAGYVDGATSGDLNLDGVDNVLDVVILVDNILNP